MKKLPVLFFYAVTCMTVFSCVYHGNRQTDITVSESDHSYSMNAHFSKRRTRDVDEYMDSRIGERSNMSFMNSRVDGRLALDDHTTFYIKKYSGFIEIEFDKDKNSEEAYHRIKGMCEGIKKLLTK